MKGKAVNYKGVNSREAEKGDKFEAVFWEKESPTWTKWHFQIFVVATTTFCCSQNTKFLFTPQNLFVSPNLCVTECHLKH